MASNLFLQTIFYRTFVHKLVAVETRTTVPNVVFWDLCLAGGASIGRQIFVAVTATRPDRREKRRRPRERVPKKRGERGGRSWEFCTDSGMQN